MVHTCLSACTVFVDMGSCQNVCHFIGKQMRKVQFVAVDRSISLINVMQFKSRSPNEWLLVVKLLELSAADSSTRPHHLLLLWDPRDCEECVPPKSPRRPLFGGRGMPGVSLLRLFSQYRQASAFLLVNWSRPHKRSLPNTSTPPLPTSNPLLLSINT